MSSIERRILLSNIVFVPLAAAWQRLPAEWLPDAPLAVAGFAAWVAIIGYSALRLTLRQHREAVQE